MGQIFGRVVGSDDKATQTPAATWEYLKKPGFEARPLRVAIVGAGVAGICLGAKILEAQKDGVLGPVEIVIYERNSDYGGVWHSNRYPGCQVDFPSHVYQFSFAPNSDWSHFFAPAAEVNTYLHHVARRYGVERFIRLRHTLQSAIFNEEKGTWNLIVETDKGDIVPSEVDVYVSAAGVLSQVNRPKIKGLELFTKNPIIHTAEWPEELDWKTIFKDEKVAVIGTGSSGLQTVGAIAPHTKNVDVYARSKVWISPPLLAEEAGNKEWNFGNAKYTEAEKERFRKDPAALLAHGAVLTRGCNHIFDAQHKDSEVQRAIKAQLRAYMQKALGDETLIKKLVPDWEVWCRRVTPAVNFVEAVRKPHVRVITDGIESVTADSIITTSGEVNKVDRIILATGFNTSFRPAYELRGRNGVSLADLWQHRAKAYMSLAVAGFPNFFCMTSGPGTYYANGSGLPCAELNADYIVSALSKLQKQDIKYMEVSQDAQDEYNEQQESVMKDLVFSGSCSSWYKNGTVDGHPDALYAGSCLQYMELIEQPRWEDWVFVPRHRNRFSYLGDGRGSHEANGGDRAHFLKLEAHAHPITTDRSLTDL